MNNDSRNEVLLSFYWYQHWKESRCSDLEFHLIALIDIYNPQEFQAFQLRPSHTLDTVSVLAGVF